MYRNRNLNIGTLNLRGIQEEHQQKDLANDMTKYNIQIMAVQETHLKGTGCKTIKDDEGNAYKLYYTCKENNTHHGLGIVVKKHLAPSFNTISDRICQMKTQVAGKQLVVICAYAPTQVTTEKDPKQTEDFYNILDGTISKESNGTLLIVAGDFNAKTGSGHERYPHIIGKYGKGKINDNGECLVETCAKNKLL